MRADRRARQRRPLGGRRSPSTTIGRWEFTSRRGPTSSRTWRDELERKVDAGQRGPRRRAVRGRRPARARRERAEGATARLDRARARRAARRRADARAVDAALGAELVAAVERYPERHGATTLEPPLPLEVDRVRARFGSWYELFPRSWGGFKGVEAQRARPRRARLRRALPAADPPDRRHEPQGPQQHARRRPRRPRLARGRSAATRAATTRSTPSSARSTTFARSSPRPREHGIDVALDFAIKRSADHPWLTEHPEWFNRRPDGTLKYAENPPKKYQDIYNFNWDSPRTGAGCGRRCWTSCCSGSTPA